MNYPLQIRFKILAFAPQIYVEDSQGKTLYYVKQKLFKLKEDIQVFSNANQNQKIARIRANQIIDWSARYFFTDNQGQEIGSVGRQGMKSLWRARYDIFHSGDKNAAFKIQEENPFAKIMDGLFGSIPILGLLSGYLFHPSYLASRPDGSLVMRLRKQPAFLEGKFSLEKLADLEFDEEVNLNFSFMMLLLLERARG